MSCRKIWDKIKSYHSVYQHNMACKCCNAAFVQIDSIILGNKPFCNMSRAALCRLMTDWCFCMFAYFVCSSHLCCSMLNQFQAICHSCAADPNDNFARPMGSAKLCCMFALSQCH